MGNFRLLASVVNPTGFMIQGGVLMRRILVAGLGVLALLMANGVPAGAAPRTPELSTGAGILAAADIVANEKPVPLGVAATQLTSRAKVSPQVFVCVSNVFITSVANGLIVSAELGYGEPFTGELRARAGAVGPWELFTVCQDDATLVVVFISQANGLLVSAELGYGDPFTGLLRARAGALGSWEQFVIVDGGGGTLAIISLGNGLAVSAELGFGEPHTGALRARAGAIGPWEQFV
jgi:hypothetical protein